MNHWPTIRTKPKASIRCFVCLAGLILLFASGCSFWKLDSAKESSPPERRTKRASEKIERADKTARDVNQVRFDGGLLLGKTDEVAYQPNELAKILIDLIEADKWTSARGLVATYPDIVNKLLMREGAQVPDQRLLQIAKLFDEKWSQSGTQGWAKFAEGLRRDPRLIEFLDTRLEFLQFVGNNQPESALELRMVDNLGRAHELAVAEALRLEGIAHLMLEDFGSCIKSLSRSASLLERDHPYLASKVLLLLGESQRHGKLLADWKATWEKAVDIQGKLIEQRRLKDPAFWTKAAFLRPVSTPWPTAAIGRVQKSLLDHNLDFAGSNTMDLEAVIWAAIGIQSLQRHESQNSILALKKSEALVATNQLKIELQIHQAMAMIDGGQLGPASAILIRLGSTESLNADRAKAMLATLKLQQGSLAQGMNLLQSSMESCQQWPRIERLRAQADYGLSYLMRGREERGVALLNHVYQEFVMLQEYEQAAQCLVNLATFYEKTEKTSEYRKTVARLRKFEAY